MWNSSAFISCLFLVANFQTFFHPLGFFKILFGTNQGGPTGSPRNSSIWPAAFAKEELENACKGMHCLHKQTLPIAQMHNHA